jgi:hypothetical protein
LPQKSPASHILQPVGYKNYKYDPNVTHHITGKDMMIAQAHNKLAKGTLHMPKIEAVKAASLAVSPIICSL